MTTQMMNTTGPRNFEATVETLLVSFASRIFPADEVRSCGQCSECKVLVRLPGHPDVFIQYNPDEDTLEVWAYEQRNYVPKKIKGILTEVFPNRFEQVRGETRELFPKYRFIRVYLELIEAIAFS